MEQFVLYPLSLYNNHCLNTHTVTKQELPKYQTKHNPTYQIDSFEKEINKKLFAKADSLLDNFLSSPGIKFSNLHTLILDCVETGVLRSDSAPQLRRKNGNVPDIYSTSLTVLVYLQLWF